MSKPERSFPSKVEPRHDQILRCKPEVIRSKSVKPVGTPVIISGRPPLLDLLEPAMGRHRRYIGTLAETRSRLFPKDHLLGLSISHRRRFFLECKRDDLLRSGDELRSIDFCFTSLA